MADCKVIVNRPNSSSPPPNCAICLGTFSNKCFSDSCMHQFCFKCLLEWSKIKPECPLCKQPFTRIIHNVKSNEEYDEHVIEITPPEDIHIVDTEDFLYLPIGNPPPATRHHFHFRTTFTVDTRGEHAIQQMLLTHPLTNGGQISVGYPPSRNIFQRIRRRDSTTTTTSFRRSIYTRNLWVSAPPDVTGRYRDISPAFFQDCPGARTRLVPWLNRELNALLYENTQLVMRLVDVIMDHLLRNHICSRTFRNLLFDYLDNKTDHFIHEFYNFMRSPFDMIGYDRNVIYSERPQSPLPHVVTLQDEISDDENDSDVIIVGSTNPEEPVVIDLVNTDSDEPILVSQENPVPIPLAEDNSEPEPAPRAPILPLKLRLKHKRQSREKKKEKKRKKRSRHHRSRSSTSSSFSCPSESSSDSSEDSYKRYKRRRKMKKLKKLLPKISDNELRVDTSSDSDIPISALIRKKKQLKKSNKPAANLYKSSKHVKMNLLPKPTKETSDVGSEGESPGANALPTSSRYTSDSLGVENGLFKTEENDSEPIDYSWHRDKSSSSTNAPSCSKYAFTTSDSSQNINAQYRVVRGALESSDELSDDDYPAHQVVKSEMNKLYPGNVNCKKYSKNRERLPNILVKREYC
ncbi:unnamed protein product [Phaedon cochleariae]|uniref:E3 ubiquitin-protein ligase Topors n=1 Tax=Phaedon cochleariae TaxID=80249 RepID=A0A9P0D909_PHACE|nr:unnamed protein product [Phaedon cochleariae]